MMKFTEAQKEELRGLIKKAWAERYTGGMNTIALAVNEIVQGYVAARTIVEEVLDRHDVPQGQTPEYDVPDDMTAYYVSFGSDPIASPRKGGKTRPEIDRLHCNPTMDRGVFEHGDVDTLANNIAAAGDAMIRAENTYVTELVATAILALGATNNVTVTGGALTMDGISAAIALMEDQGLRVGKILTRGQHLEKFTAANAPTYSDDRVLKGAVNEYHGATIFNIPQMSASQVILLPEVPIGKYPNVKKMTTETSIEKFKVDILSWKEIGYSLLLSKWATMVTITA